MLFLRGARLGFARAVFFGMGSPCVEMFPSTSLRMQRLYNQRAEKRAASTTIVVARDGSYVTSDTATYSSSVALK